MQSMLKCENCQLGDKEATLKECSGCKSTRYCSKECQRAHWQKHKDRCRRNQSQIAVLNARDESLLGQMFRLVLPDGITITELGERMEKWYTFHQRLLMDAWFHCLRVSQDLDNTRRYVMYVRIEPREDHGGNRGKYFRIEEVCKLDIAEAETRPRPWPQSLALLRQQADEYWRTGKGRSGAAIIECQPIPIRMLPFASIFESAKRVRYVPHWKETLLSEVEAGRKFDGFKFGRR